MNYFDREIVSTPIHNYNNDKILQCNEERGWKRPFPDDMPYQGPFVAKQGLNIEMKTKKPEDFFNLMFDTRMFETIADETNQYDLKPNQKLYSRKGSNTTNGSCRQ